MEPGGKVPRIRLQTRLCALILHWKSDSFGAVDEGQGHRVRQQSIIAAMIAIRIQLGVA